MNSKNLWAMFYIAIVLMMLAAFVEKGQIDMVVLTNFIYGFGGSAVTISAIELVRRWERKRNADIAAIYKEAEERRKNCNRG